MPCVCGRLLGSRAVLCYGSVRCRSGTWPLSHVKNSSFRLLFSCHGAGIKMAQWFWKPLLPLSSVAFLLTPHCPHTVSDNVCLLNEATVPSSFSSKHRNQDNGFPSWAPVQQRRMHPGRGPSNSWPRLLGRAGSRSPGLIHLVEISKCLVGITVQPWSRGVVFLLVKNKHY